MKRLVESMGEYLLTRGPRTLLIFVGLSIILMMGAQIGMLKGRFQQSRETQWEIARLRAVNSDLRMHRELCLNFYERATILEVMGARVDYGEGTRSYRE